MPEPESSRTSAEEPTLDVEGPALVVVCGLPGVGKSTVSRLIAERLDAAVLRTDVVRKELFDEPGYASAETEAVYDEVLARTANVLDETGRSVVLDGTFRRRDHRDDARRVAESVGCPFRLVHVRADESVVERRIADREGVSDADFEVHRELKERFDPVEDPDLRVDNSGSAAETRRQVDEAF